MRRSMRLFIILLMILCAVMCMAATAFAAEYEDDIKSIEVICDADGDGTADDFNDIIKEELFEGVKSEHINYYRNKVQFKATLNNGDIRLYTYQTKDIFSGWYCEDQELYVHGLDVPDEGLAGGDNELRFELVAWSSEAMDYITCYSANTVSVYANPKPVSIEFIQVNGRPVEGSAGDSRISVQELNVANYTEHYLNSIYTPGNKLVVGYPDGHFDEYICRVDDVKARFTLRGESGADNICFAFDCDSPMKVGDNAAVIRLLGIEKKGYPGYWGDFDETVTGDQINVHVYGDPVSAEFIPAEDNTMKAHIGADYIDDSILDVPGNKLVVTYESGRTLDYIHVETITGYHGYWLNGETDMLRTLRDHPAVVYQLSPVKMVKGANTVTLNASIPVGSLDDDDFVKLRINVSVNADKYGVDVEPTADLTYTGKSQKPKIVLRDTAGRVVPASAYTTNIKAEKNVGYYTFKATLKNDNYEPLYETGLIGSYRIQPKAPVIKKVKAGKKSFTVTWKKLTSAEQKQVANLVIEYSAYKNFRIANTVKVSKKSSSKTIKNLSKNKTYYVRIRAVRTTKYGKLTVYFKSKNSKKLKVKTK